MYFVRTSLFLLFAFVCLGVQMPEVAKADLIDNLDSRNTIGRSIRRSTSAARSFGFRRPSQSIGSNKYEGRRMAWMKRQRDYEKKLARFERKQRNAEIKAARKLAKQKKAAMRKAEERQRKALSKKRKSRIAKAKQKKQKSAENSQRTFVAQQNAPAPVSIQPPMGIEWQEQPPQAGETIASRGMFERSESAQPAEPKKQGIWFHLKRALPGTS